MRTTIHLLLVASIGCGASGDVVRDEPDRLAVERLWPMAEGNVWTFDIDDGTGETAFHFLRVVRVSGAQRVVAVPSGESETYEVRQGGLYNVSRDHWTLKQPLREGAEWPARSGRTARVTSVEAQVEVPAGRFEGCVMVHESGSESGLEVRTTYCADVGVVLIDTVMPLETSGLPARVTARLRAHQLSSP